MNIGRMLWLLLCSINSGLAFGFEGRGLLFIFDWAFYYCSLD